MKISKNKKIGTSKMFFYQNFRRGSSLFVKKLLCYFSLSIPISLCKLYLKLILVEEEFIINLIYK